MTDDELSLVMDDSFDKEFKIVKKILLSDNDQRDVLVMELTRQKEESNSYVDEYYRRPNHDDIELYDGIAPIIKVFDDHNKLTNLRKNMAEEDYGVYVFDEMMFNHNYNDSLTLFDMIKWYMDTHEMSEESRNYLIDFFLEKSCSNSYIVALRNELVGVHLDLDVTSDHINFMNNKELLTDVINIRNMSTTFKSMSDIIMDKFNGDYSNQLLCYKIIIAHTYAMADKYGIPREEFGFEEEINHSINNLSRDDKRSKAVEGLKTLISDSAMLLEEYNKGSKEHRQR